MDSLPDSTPMAPSARPTEGAHRVALTFDAELQGRPAEPGAPESILDTLGLAGVRATFFVQGRWADAFPALAARLGAEGHLVGSHSHHHAPMRLLTSAGIRADIAAAEASIRAATGADPRPLFRSPFGHWEAGPRVVRVLADLGYRDVGWSVDSRDYESTSPAEVADRVAAGTDRHGDGAIVLFHTWSSATAAALPAVLERLRSAGVTFVGIDALPPEVPHRSRLPAWLADRIGR